MVARTWGWLAVAATLLPAVMVRQRAADPIACRPQRMVSNDWTFDHLTLSNNRTLDGLIEKEEAGTISFLQVLRPAGKEMYFVRVQVPKNSVTSEKRLTEPARAELAERVLQYRNRGAVESDAMVVLALRRDKDSKWPVYLYDGQWFHCKSSADEETTRRAIVRMEKIFCAYRAMVPPRVKAESPLNIYLAGSSAEYQAALAAQGVKLTNPAFFSPFDNVVFTGLDITRMKAELERVNAYHDKLNERLKDSEKQLRAELFRLSTDAKKKGATSQQLTALNQQVNIQFEQRVQPIKKELAMHNRRNAGSFDEMTRQTFAMLYHEAFHAYLANYVYPHDRYDVPHWLDEGLAQLFEFGVMEADTLRIDAPPAETLSQLQTDLRSVTALRLETLLSTDGRDFLVASNQDKNDLRTSQRSYVYSWGLAYYLTMERHLLGTEALDKYVALSPMQQAALKKSAKSSDNDPKPKRASPKVDETSTPVGPPSIPPQSSLERSERFEALVGMPLEQFEKEWRAYMLALKPTARSVKTPAPPKKK